MAIMEHMERTAGTISVRGRVAYASQQAFLLSTTIRENILFGSDFNQNEYEEAISVSTCISAIIIHY